ncbi:MAG: S46 family peptidase [Deltaproteobacteria bacterium]|nr:S46 family peptidase [Deltaproteobacteria bacterium]
MRARFPRAFVMVVFFLLCAPGCRSGQKHAGGHEKVKPSTCRPEVEALPPSGEGQWPWTSLDQMDERELFARGLKLRLSEIWTPGQGGIARAAVGMKGCSASFVSPDGLLITNHHCAYRAIQRNSSDERNLIEDGFLASSRQDELDGHGLRVLLFRQHSDVTQEVLGGMADGLSDLERIEHIEKREKEIVKKCEAKPDTRCLVSRENHGLRFVLLEKLELRDVRLVAAPPESLGSYGGEVDNWRWPRHSMDFAVLRAYVDGDGKPAGYDPSNVPFHPEEHFQVSVDGVSQDDLVMVLGTPYHTDRYKTTHDVRQALEWYYPLRSDLFSEWIRVLEKTCEEIPDSCLPTASRVRGLNNGLTNARGMIAGLERAKLVQRKQDQLQEWIEWVEADPARNKRWRSSHDDLVEYLEQSRSGRDRDFLVKYVLIGSQVLGFARTITKWAAERQKPDEEREPGYQERDREDLLSDLKQAQRSLHIEADRRVLALFLARLGRLPPSERLQAFDSALMDPLTLAPDYGAAGIDLYVTALYTGTTLGDEASREKLFNSTLDELKASTDTMVLLALALAPELDAWDERKKERAGALSRLRPPYLESLIEMRGARFYPDANASPRISFATVAGYSPRDGVWHTPISTLGGLLEKATGKEPFDPPGAVVEAIKAGRHGAYADEALGDVPVCFLSNADTTGGNSGSPVLDGHGRLVGLNFDRVYENIAGDYGYNPELSRNVMVDVRSVLWYLDVILGAQHLLEEMSVTHAPAGEAHH